MCELAKRISVPVSMDFMCVGSYGDGTSSSGVVRIAKDLDESIENKEVLIVEDIIDSDDGVRKVVSSIVEYYALASGKSLDYIGRGDFIVYMKTAYGTNTDTQQMAEIKNQIDKWLSDNMYKYGRANFGKTVRQSYRKSVYMFFVFMINMEAKA